MLSNRIQIGRYDVRLVIQSNTPSVNATTNEREASWSTVTTVWAKRLTNGGAERFEADQEVSNNTEIYEIRYSSDVSGMDSTYRVYESGTTDYHYVKLVEKQKREGWIKLTTEIRNE